MSSQRSVELPVTVFLVRRNEIGAARWARAMDPGARGGDARRDDRPYRARQRRAGNELGDGLQRVAAVLGPGRSDIALSPPDGALSPLSGVNRDGAHFGARLLDSPRRRVSASRARPGPDVGGGDRGADRARSNHGVDEQRAHHCGAAPLGRHAVSRRRDDDRGRVVHRARSVVVVAPPTRTTRLGRPWWVLPGGHLGFDRGQRRSAVGVHVVAGVFLEPGDDGARGDPTGPPFNGARRVTPRRGLPGQCVAQEGDGPG